jgi:ubiquinone/menaquinone biosynthesis C-methylase UbiE
MPQSPSLSAVDESAWHLFDRVAAEYDEVVPFFAEYGIAIVALLDPPAGCRFLDVGAGRGALTAPALQRGCVVTAIDAAPAMIQRLAASYPAAATQVMNAEALMFPEDSFDLVASAFVIHLLDDPAAGVAEAYRVLAPGGRFAFTGNNVPGSGRGNTSADQPSLARLLDALFMEFTPYLRPGKSMGRPVDAAQLLTDAGFVDIRAENAEVAIEFADNEMLWRWAMSHGYRAFIERRVAGIWSGRKPR